MSAADVDAWRARCEPKALAAIDMLRDAVLAASPAVTEGIKWNAPSFALDGQDRITLGIERKGGVRAVVHRGAAKSDDHFRFEDTAQLASWPSADRGVMIFPDAESVLAKREQLIDLFARWLDADK